MPACEYVHVNTGAHRGQKKAPYPLELDLQSDMSLFMWLLQIELESYAKAVHARNY